MAQMVKSLPAVQETWVQSLGWEDPWRKAWQPTPVFLPEESHGLRSLAEYSPWGNKKSDIIKRLIHTHFYIKLVSFTHYSIYAYVTDGQMDG